MISRKLKVLQLWRGGEWTNCTQSLHQDQERTIRVVSQRAVTQFLPYTRGQWQQEKNGPLQHLFLQTVGGGSTYGLQSEQNSKTQHNCSLFSPGLLLASARDEATRWGHLPTEKKKIRHQSPRKSQLCLWSKWSFDDWTASRRKWIWIFRLAGKWNDLMILYYKDSEMASNSISPQ